MVFAPQRATNVQSGRPPSLLKTGVNFGFGFDYSRGTLLSALPVGAAVLVGAILAQPPPPRSSVSKVPVAPATFEPLVPSTAGRGTISKEEQLAEILRQRAILEEIIRKQPTGTGTLPPIDEEKWGDIIRIPVPKPTTAPRPVQVVDADAIIGDPTDQTPPEDQETPMDWGTVLSGVIGGVVQDRANQYAASSFQQPSGVPYGVPYTTRTTAPAYDMEGKLCIRRRRRRRRLLTDSDYNDLMRIGTLPNKEGVKIALAKAIGRGR